MRKGVDETGIKIPKELADAVDAIIVYGNLGYRSRQEFCTEAIRWFIRQCNRDLKDLNEIVEKIRRRRTSKVELMRG